MEPRGAGGRGYSGPGVWFSGRGAERGGDDKKKQQQFQVNFNNKKTTRVYLRLVLLGFPCSSQPQNRLIIFTAVNLTV